MSPSTSSLEAGSSSPGADQHTTSSQPGFVDPHNNPFSVQQPPATPSSANRNPNVDFCWVRFDGSQVSSSQQGLTAKTPAVSAQGNSVLGGGLSTDKDTPELVNINYNIFTQRADTLGVQHEQRIKNNGVLELSASSPPTSLMASPSTHNNKLVEISLPAYQATSFSSRNSGDDSLAQDSFGTISNSSSNSSPISNYQSRDSSQVNALATSSPITNPSSSSQLRPGLSLSPSPSVIVVVKDGGRICVHKGTQTCWDDEDEVVEESPLGRRTVVRAPSPFSVVLDENDSDQGVVDLGGEDDEDEDENHRHGRDEFRIDPPLEGSELDAADGEAPGRQNDWLDYQRDLTKKDDQIAYLTQDNELWEQAYRSIRDGLPSQYRRPRDAKGRYMADPGAPHSKKNNKNRVNKNNGGKRPRRTDAQLCRDMAERFGYLEVGRARDDSFELREDDEIHFDYEYGGLGGGGEASRASRALTQELWGRRQARQRMNA